MIVNCVAAKALGLLVAKFGEVNFPTIIKDLVAVLNLDVSGVDRQGSAQGLAEILAGLEITRLEDLLPEIVASTFSPKPYVREGFMSLLVYLPATLGTRFQVYVGRIIPSILKGLADESEYVCEISMRAGKIVINNYAKTAVELFLPELESGLFDENWKIRQSSVHLMGELLYKIVGISGPTVEEEEEQEQEQEGEIQGTEADRKKLVEVLGQERRDSVLAALYVVRADGKNY